MISIPGSEVAQLKEQIMLEYEAARAGITGYATVARHDFIAHRYETIGEYHEQLKQQVGQQEAARILCEIMEGKKG